MIRTAGAADAAAIRALMKSIPGFWDETWQPDLLERVLGSSDAVALVHEAKGVIDGFVCAHDVGFRAYLSELIVSPSVQGTGIGGRLLAEVEARLTRRGCTVVIADVWQDADAFYRSHGWEPPQVVLLRKRLRRRDASDDALPASNERMRR
jgi:GNAT superfamily N-acetyltransferase